MTFKLTNCYTLFGENSAFLKGPLNPFWWNARVKFIPLARMKRKKAPRRWNGVTAGETKNDKDPKNFSFMALSAVENIPPPKKKQPLHLGRLGVSRDSRRLFCKLANLYLQLLGEQMLAFVIVYTLCNSINLCE